MVLLAGGSAARGTTPRLERFRTPDDTIRCTWAPPPLGFLRCDVRRAYARTPRPPARCSGLAWGDAFRLGPTGGASLYCHGDTAFGGDRPAARSSWRGHGIACAVGRSAVTCTNRSGRGFALGRARFRLLPSYTAATCPFAPPQGARVDCGRLTVPENRARPGRTITLPVAVFRSARPRREPVLWLAGGPGGAALVLAQHLYPTIVAPFLAERDMVVFDQRGTGWAEPALACRDDESDAACLLRWKRAGVDLSAYTSAATADDAEDLRRALGIERWDVFGESYGTRVALTILRDHPQHVRSAILDSVVPPNAPGDDRGAHAIRELIAAAALPYPGLGETLRLAAAQRPQIAEDVLYALYDAPNVARLPRAIDAAARGLPDPLWAEVERWKKTTSSLLSRGTHVVQLCNERLPPPPIDACRAAGLHAPPREGRAVRSRVPTLLVTGRFDPVTPPPGARLAARTLSRSRLVVFPTLSHWVTEWSACARRIENAFLDAPLARPDTSCVARTIAWEPRR